MNTQCIREHRKWFKSKFDYLFLIWLGMLFWTPSLWAENSLPEDLTELSLEALMSIEVTTVSRKTEKLSDAAAAVFVITSEDIRRSGATNIPDLLRMVPGLQVAKIDANKWAITSRGFNGRFANKLLVLMDGRTIYSPIFSGVLWDSQDTLLEDIERIEIIRGPGATLWGANAVNGVINIITKNAADTQGVIATTGLGTEEKFFGSVRYGESISDHTQFRIYTKYFNRDGNVDEEGEDCKDQWYQWRSGFRLDGKYSENNQLTLQGDIYQGQSSETISYPLPQTNYPFFEVTTQEADSELFGGNLLGRFRHVISKSSDLAFQLYYDRAVYNPIVMDILVDTFDADFQHRFGLFEHQSIIWGMGYRYILDKTEGTYSTILDPDDQTYNLISAFVQDDITLIPEYVHLSIGTKFEHNDFSGDEWQPSIHLLWTPNSHQTIWSAISRAVRTPSRGDVANRVRQAVPEIPSLLTEISGNPDFKAEEVLAYELGYRVQPTVNLSVDIATFCNYYNNGRGVSVQEPVLNSPPEASFVPIQVENNIKGKSFGTEVAADWRVFHWWRLLIAYTYLELDLKSKSEEAALVTKQEEDSAPHHQASLRSFFDLNNAWQLDLWFRYVDALPAFDIHSYLEMDTHLNWRISKGMEFTLVGQNLLDNHHPEFVAEYLDTQATETQRSVYAKMTLRF